MLWMIFLVSLIDLNLQCLSQESYSYSHRKTIISCCELCVTSLVTNLQCLSQESYSRLLRNYVHSSYTWLCSPQACNNNNNNFGDLGVRVVTAHRFLGGFIGDSSDRQNFVLQKVLQWSGHVRTLAAVASSQPQAAFAALTKSLRSEWLFS